MAWNPIESAFTTVRLRTRVTKGIGSRAAALAMVLKPVESARAPLAGREPDLVALVRFLDDHIARQVPVR